MVLQIDLITQHYAAIFQKILKEGPLLKNCNSFKRWKLRYFLVRGQRLCFAHHPAVREYIYILVSWVNGWVPGNVLWGDGPTCWQALRWLTLTCSTRPLDRPYPIIFSSVNL